MFDTSKFKELYLGEAEDLLQKLNEGLLALEKDPADNTILQTLMQSSHTLKSSSATMGYSKLAFLMHVTEDVFDAAKKGTFALRPDIMSELFHTADSIEKCIEEIRKSGAETDLSESAEALKKLTGVATVGVGKSPKVDGTSASLPTAQEFIRKIEKVDYIKVPMIRLDDLLNLTEEILIDKMRLETLVDPRSPSIVGSSENEALSRAPLMKDLRDAVEHLNRLTGSLQYRVMQARLTPVGQIFSRFPRMVHDLAASQGKEIEFVVSGGELELDRTIIDKLGEPVVHLLRNAVDHGIRKKGTITLRAEREKDLAKIYIEDDGEGIDTEKIKELAVRKGIVTAADADSLDEQTAISLLYRFGLSTREEVTETSGRGVGLGVVKNFMEQFGGQLLAESKYKDGRGTRFTLEFPLTIAIIRVLLAESAGSVFALPFSNVLRSVDVAPDQVKSMGDQDVAIIDGMNVPLVRLSTLFDLGKEDAGARSRRAVLVKKGADLAGIMVGRLLGEQEVIVKPLPPVLRGTKCFSGSAILGDGKTVLILDVASLFNDGRKFLRVEA